MSKNGGRVRKRFIVSASKIRALKALVAADIQPEMLSAYRTGEEIFQQWNCDVYWCSSITSMPFQNLDFGWGKPSRSSFASGPFSKFFQLMSTHEEGIEVFVNLEEKYMSNFEHDKNLLQFATPVDQDVQGSLILTERCHY
ncbi:hypothetical protein HAX54_046044 [Datura stramonium]|uniref:Uncharacterized protein n=1 Tax=Datura stramonium TaxID=4076 RepID=A0ABS8SQU9_DATST|nr:hypothetical protein [Datura stramonium]